MIESIPHLVWQSNPLGDWIWASRQWAAFTGQGPGRSRGYGWLDAIHPEDRERTREAWQQAARQGRLSIEHRLCRRDADGEAYVWFSTRAEPRRDGDGRPTAWFGTSTDIHALHAIREEQARLVHELQRRTRNNLAVIRGIVRRVADGASGEDVASHIDDRLAALARIQASITREPLAGVALDVLIRNELSAHALPEPSEFAGPPLRLPAEMAEKLGLVLHELALGAALDGHDRIAVTWSAAATHLTVTWREGARPGARPVIDATPQGGMQGGALRGEMLERMLAYDLRATTTVAETGRERRIVIALPLPG
ncbi:hypothetical protein A5481_13000 [Methylobacterium platani]|uniref:Blue-light-activated histidine kinase n=2 Tax=Methylobacterium platani TaxID=427683 RepID=A0A179SB85_9HYPH|nr:hypothetical protein A5481_13000 [Methylobacterium platani]